MARVEPGTPKANRGRRRKRCPYCWCLFVLDPRVTARQWACGKASCQAERRRETQRRYRASHPDDPAARRLRTAIAAAKAGGLAAAPHGPPLVIGRFPWDELRDEIPPQGMVILRFLIQLILEAVRDEIRLQAAKIKKNGR